MNRRLGIRDADCGCCVVVDQVAFRATIRAVEDFAALADKWDAEVSEARAHGTPNPMSSKRAHERALRRILARWTEALA